MELLGGREGSPEAVCFFDSSVKKWMLLEARGRCLPRGQSPVNESRAFVIFDDARCRGADLQLRADAVGLLTLGPTTCKDKMMQAAGRWVEAGPYLDIAWLTATSQTP